MLTRFRRLFPLLCGALVLFCAGSAPAAVVSPEIDESGSVIVTSEMAEVREGPALNFGVVTVVAKGEIFDKQGRTGAWYYIRINEDSFGWISGRAVSRYLADETPLTYVEPRDRPVESGAYPYYPYYPYYPNNYYGYFYDYPFYFWGQPYFSSDYYYYDYYRYWGHSRGYVNAYPRYRVYPRYRDDGWKRGSAPQRRYGVPTPRLPGPAPRLNSPAPRPPIPRIRPRLPHR